MLNWLYTALLSGHPTAAGMFLLLNPDRGHDHGRTVGIMLFGWGILVTVWFALLVPNGRLLEGNFRLISLVVFFSAIFVGAVLGYLKRNGR
ncbi:hypothetical protein [Ruegeria profundi]|uniref:hypothetical protein n=1 Tax=Ruegeria profundi TaxID=1685378 RepID=UPI001CD4F67A|nr:hypothetical protein [Ruegeria profundi]MCA0930459.1 hypothetical protein [Ruegeria profundi]